MRLLKPFFAILVAAIIAFATGSLAAQTPAASSDTKSAPAKKAEMPLTALPYTPSLDVPSMDTTANPCVDFYQFTCGGWMKNNPIPPDQPAWSVYGKLAQDNQRFLWGILEDLAKKTSARTPQQQQLGDYFGACMDETAVEKLGARPLKADLDAIAALKSKKDLAALLA